MNIGMPQFDVPPVDPKTGQWNRIWWLFLSQLWTRTGAAQGQSSDELAVDLPEDSGVEELKDSLNRLSDAVYQSQRIEALEAQMQQLMTQIDELKQGAQL